MKLPKYIPWNIRKMFKTIPKSTLMVTVPHCIYWLEFKYKANKTWEITMCDTRWQRKKIIARGLNAKGVKTIIEFTCMPHKEPWSPEAFLKEAKKFLRKSKNKNKKR